MDSRHLYGRDSEKRAEKLLKRKKHRIVARNYLARHGEVDIISVASGEILVFTEVRSKHDCTYGHPIETIDHSKQARVRSAAEQFLYEHPEFQAFACRFDVVTVSGEGKKATVEYFPDAF